MELHEQVHIGDTVVGPDYPAFVIAEAGVNHFGRMELAKHLVDMAVVAGANAVKFQIFKAENMISLAAQDWIRRMKSKELSYDCFVELQEYCVQKNIIFMATAHDEESFEFLTTLSPLAYKIGSGEINNPFFIQKIARQKKPVFLSTGMYTLQDIQDTLDVFVQEKNQDVILLHCNTAYPPSSHDINLRAIDTMRMTFNCPVGYSDHNVGNSIALAAVARGAMALEKHIAVYKNTPGSQDCPVSCDQDDLIELVNEIRRIEMALGSYEKKPSESEVKNREWAGKSIVAKVDIKSGQEIREDLLVFKRPGIGISPSHLHVVVGKKAKSDILQDSLVTYDDIK